MPRTREVGTLWIGGKLSWMEQLCLKSFVDHGQKITLFHYEDISNVPKGVICRDGREVIDTDDFIKYEQKNSYALFADLFRLHMIARNPGMIWVDTDVYCQRPMDYDDDYVFGYELPDSDRVNNAVLGFPPDSPALKAMLEFTSDRYSIAPFLPGGMRRRFKEAKDAGEPVHITQQPWGVWGPMMLTWYVKKFQLDEHVKPLPAFYPVTFRERKIFNHSIEKVRQKITEETTALHVWASNKTNLGNHRLGLPPKGSWWEDAVKRHNINPALAPIVGRSTTSFDAALFDRVPRIEGELMDVGGNSPSLAISLFARDHCPIQLVDLDHRGSFGGQTDAMERYIATLESHEVPRDAIRVVSKHEDIRPADVILNLRGIGDRGRIKHLIPVLDRGLHADSLLFLDIRKGSGAFPFLKRHYGETEILDELDGRELRRVLMRPKPPATVAETDESWAGIARGLAGRDGFFRDGPGGHSFLFVPRDPKVLVVTFDNLDIAMNKRDDRRPWGYDFIEKQGWSMLGVLAGGWTWYREPWVSEQFDRLRDEGFFKRFERVVFYGASMGGYAAAAFSPACPGADVLAISPQSTLDRQLVPFETRYRTAWGYDYGGPYGDAAAVSRAAGKVTILYDPYEPLDTGHVDRFTGENVVKLRCPMMGHRLGSSLSQMGVLSGTILKVLSGELEPLDFYRSLRARHEFPRYQRELFNRAIARGHPDLARKVAKWVLARGDNRAIRRGMISLETG